MQISPEYLTAATGCTALRALLYAPLLDSTAVKWGIDTPLRRAAWIAQVAHESTLFSRVEESLYYTTPARLIAVWPSRFRLPFSEGEERSDEFLDGKRNARKYIRDPEKLANFVYSGRMGNGSENSGDGWSFIGRGLIQLTGRNNYSRYDRASKYPVLVNPSMVAWPLIAADSAGWFWSANGCNELADARDFAGLSRRINGGTVGLADRQRLTLAALKAGGSLV